jgi:hypothetical protein
MDILLFFGVVFSFFFCFDGLSSVYSVTCGGVLCGRVYYLHEVCGGVLCEQVFYSCQACLVFGVFCLFCVCFFAMNSSCTGICLEYVFCFALFWCFIFQFFVWY